VSREWSKDQDGHRTLRLSRGCSSRDQCTPGWSRWPYTDDHIYDDSDESDSSDSSDSSDGSDDSDDESTYWSYQPPSYSYYAVHTSCPATSCQPPTGKLDHFTQYTAKETPPPPWPPLAQLRFNGHTSGEHGSNMASLVFFLCCFPWRE